LTVDFVGLAEAAELAGIGRAALSLRLPHRAARSRELAAKIAGVSERLIQNAIAVGEKAPDLYELARAGELSAEQALEQDQAARKPRHCSQTAAASEGPLRGALCRCALAVAEPRLEVVTRAALPDNVST
jgi:hypothetical protein